MGPSVSSTVTTGTGNTTTVGNAREEDLRVASAIACEANVCTASDSPICTDVPSTLFTLEASEADQAWLLRRAAHKEQV